MNDRTVTVLGGTGFLGRRIVRHLRAHGFCVRTASRHASRDRKLFGRHDPQLQPVEANIHEDRSIADAIAGAYGVVNAVSLYVERGNDTFHSVHVESAKRVAAQAHIAGVERLVHVSGIGADATAQSIYIRKRGEGELAVQAAFPNSVIFRPAVMFGLDDAFLTTVLELLRRLPAIQCSAAVTCDYSPSTWKTSPKLWRLRCNRTQRRRLSSAAVLAFTPTPNF
jgi:uncharacterized protein YbjT (DUF2867 family)